MLFAVASSAQENKIAFENLVNEQFGTLLESLISDGKLDVNGAKSYLETVFGYDDTVASYLQSSQFSQQFSSLNLNTKNLRGGSLLPQLNSSLISIIPAEKQQAFMQNMNAQMIVQGSMNEMLNGKVGSNTVALAAGIIAGSAEARAERLKREAAIQKLEVITPTLTKLNANATPYEKLSIVDNMNSADNWIINSNPPVLNETVENIFTTNASTFEYGGLKIHTQNYITAFWNWDKNTRYENGRFYKNAEKFDFSKDFVMHLYLQSNDYTHNFKIQIGKGYQVSVLPEANGNCTWITSPEFYQVSDRYGVLWPTMGPKKDRIKNAVTGQNKSRKLFSGKSRQWGSYILYRNKKNPDITFVDNIVKLTITKRGDIFSFKINDLAETEISNQINYFPDKYYLGFEVNPKPLSGKKAWIKISKMELQHL